MIGLHAADPLWTFIVMQFGMVMQYGPRCMAITEGGCECSRVEGITDAIPYSTLRAQKG
jgi:hypothetical protein